MQKLPSQEELHKLFHYDTQSGKLYWKIKPTARINIGDEAGCYHSNGYRWVMYKYKRYYTHRLVWKHVYGTDPVNEIDHINRIRDDNRIENLRDVCHQKNANNRVGKGYQYSYGKYRAYIQYPGGKTVRLGSYDCPLMAHLAYRDAKAAYDQLHSSR